MPGARFDLSQTKTLFLCQVEPVQAILKVLEDTYSSIVHSGLIVKSVSIICRTPSALYNGPLNGVLIESSRCSAAALL